MRRTPGIASGKVYWCQGFSETGAGSDLASLRTLAVKVDGGWRLSGTKVFISHAAHAGLFLVVATVDREKKHRGVTAFLVDPHSEGIRISDFPMRTLRRDNLAEVHFEDAFVPDEGLLGEPGKGFPVLGSALDTGRFSVAAPAMSCGSSSIMAGESEFKPSGRLSVMISVLPRRSTFRSSVMLC